MSAKIAYHCIGICAFGLNGSGSLVARMWQRFAKLSILGTDFASPAPINRGLSAVASIIASAANITHLSPPTSAASASARTRHSGLRCCQFQSRVML